jgi:hypothetical protein
MRQLGPVRFMACVREAGRGSNQASRVAYCVAARSALRDSVCFISALISALYDSIISALSCASSRLHLSSVKGDGMDKWSE